MTDHKADKDKEASNSTSNSPPAATPAAVPHPSVQEQAASQVQAAASKAKEAMGQVKQAAAIAGQAGQQVTQVTGQAQQLMSQAKDLLTSKPTQPQPPVAQDEKVWAALSYIPMVALVAFLIKPKSEYVKLHGRQGLMLFLLYFVSGFIMLLLPDLLAMLVAFFLFVLFVLGIFSIYQALVGNWWKTPVLGQLADMLPVEMFTSVATKAITGQEPTQGVEQTPPAAPPSPPTPPPAA